MYEGVFIRTEIYELTPELLGCFLCLKSRRRMFRRVFTYIGSFLSAGGCIMTTGRLNGSDGFRFFIFGS